VAPPSPSIRVDGTAVVGNLPEPGGTFTGRAVVTNTSTEALTLTALADEDLNGVGTCSVPQPLAVGGTYSCTFPIVFTGKAGDTKTVPVTATAVDASGRQATAQDTFVITITSVVTPVVVFPPPAGLSFPLTPQVIGPLARTGTDLTDRILLALVLVLAGTLMLVATWRRAISPGQARRSKAFARRDDPGSWTG